MTRKQIIGHIFLRIWERLVLLVIIHKAQNNLWEIPWKPSLRMDNASQYNLQWPRSVMELQRQKVCTVSTYK